MIKQFQSLLIIFFLFFTLFSCGQDFNSNSNDEGQYSTVTIDSSTPEGARFSAAYKVIQTQCMGCHDWASYDTKEKWTEAYVVAGNYAGSPLISILKNYGGSMPKDPYPALSPADLVVLENWISNL